MGIDWDKDRLVLSKEADELDECPKPIQEAERCPVCNNFERKELPGHIQQPRLAFDFIPTALELSAPQCPYCTILLASIREFEPEIGGLSSSASRIYATSSLPTQTLSLEIYFKEDSRPKLELELYVRTNCGTLPAKAIQLREQPFHPRETLSEESLSWVQTHAEECLGSHANCPQTREAPLPPRVLSLTNTSTGSIEVVLRETNGMKGVYACLSHRWGESEPGITTNRSYKGLLAGIPWASIPRTFQDAIIFSLSIGIKNIWIDSLCIIQDDQHDWQEQASHMASIYQNSYITLAATSSPNSDSGCFWKPDDSFERTFVTRAGSFSVRRTMRHWGKAWMSNTATMFPLLTRAWVFQERLLAPRVLHFSHRELVWECMQAGDCQCGGYDGESNPKRHDWTSEKSWRLAVELFTSLRLTRVEDRLPALLGFADFYARSTNVVIGKEYFTGLWRKSLHLDLLWRVDSSSLDPESKPLRLCRCFDLHTATEVDQRCQYSYSAACSPQCLEQRRFCRFGEPEALVSYSCKFSGSCPGQGDTRTSTQELRQLYRGVDLDDDPYLGPSWSWVSANIRVKFWEDIQHIPPGPGSRRDNLTPCEVRHVQVDHDGRYLTGSVRSGMLRVNGWIAYAYLQYRYEPDPNSQVMGHSPFRYGLAFRENRPHLEFYPDYILSFEGQKWMPSNTPLFLLHVSSGFHLVLQEKKYFELDLKGRVRQALQRKRQIESLGSDLPGLRFVRIGILRSPRASKDETYWEARWMDGIEIE